MSNYRTMNCGIGSSWGACGICDVCNYMFDAQTKMNREEWLRDCIEYRIKKLKREKRMREEIEAKIRDDEGECANEMWTIAMPDPRTSLDEWLVTDELCGAIKSEDDFNIHNLAMVMAQVEWCKKTVERIIKKDVMGMGNMMACIEWYSDKHPEGGNPHVHMLVEPRGKTRFGAKVKKMAQMFQVEENFVDRKVDSKGEAFLNRCAYIQGKKKNDAYAQKDAEFRVCMGCWEFACSFRESWKQRGGIDDEKGEHFPSH